MVNRELARTRLVAQGLVDRPFRTPLEVARAFGASQGQDLPGVIASLALRCSLESGEPADGGVGAVVEEFAAGRIVRGYPMRGTVFVVAAEDLAWMTQLCADGPIRAAIARRPGLGLTDEHVHRAREILETALTGEPARERETQGSGAGVISRTDLFAAWEEGGVPVAGGCGYHLLVHLISTGVAAYGPTDGRDHHVVLAAQWLPTGSDLEGRFDGDRTAAAAELLRRYLLSRGPATLRDAAWFTKLPLTLLRRAFSLIRDDVEDAGPDAAGEMRFQAPGLTQRVQQLGSQADRLFLLPGFDEFVLGYRDRTDHVQAEHHPLLVPGNNGVFQRSIVRRGEIVGRWNRAGSTGRRRLVVEPFGRWPAVAQRDADRAFARFPFATA
ncbi:AlkZ family DNA glycosylase [Brachybacterium sp. EF45031]|uniref:winged helix DNA-binding domain-containing protein n=1 Tax=Brachybacterium sillae TaxID=2810536 RepID=UPI00217E1F60|nr:winged helix DNA-binding domain-containing protein [Brachybacterium sillae]MCS6710633.1 AlkZ family DNA glycosylase [Brachybacterium sillae]